MHFLISHCRCAPHGILSLLFGGIMKRFSRDRKSTKATLPERERRRVGNSDFHNSVGGIFNLKRFADDNNEAGKLADAGKRGIWRF